MAYWIPFFGKQTKAYLVAVKWNFESGHYNNHIKMRLQIKQLLLLQPDTVYYV
jgi:hypothetical protein